MRTYYIFNVNKYYNYMYRNKPYKMYKIFEEIYRTKDYDKVLTYGIFEQIANPFNKIMINEYIYYEYKFKYGYKREENRHILNNGENSTLIVNNYNIKLKTINNYSKFFDILSTYNNNLFVCDFENSDYFWLSKLRSNALQKL